MIISADATLRDLRSEAEEHASFGDGPSRAALAEAWYRAAVGLAPSPLPELERPWSTAAAGSMAVLSRHAARTQGDVGAARRLVSGLLELMHKAGWAIERDPAHPRRSDAARSLAAARKEPTQALMKRVRREGESLEATYAGTARRWAFLREVCDRRGRFGRRAIERRVLRERIMQRWEQDQREAERGFEEGLLRGALEAFELSLERKMSALRRIEEVFGAVPGFLGRGGDWSSGYWRDGTWEQLERLARELEARPWLKSIARHLGRWEEEESKLRYREVVELVKHTEIVRARGEASEIRGLHFSDDLARVLPSELALLADEETADLFYLRLAEKRLLSFEMDGRVVFETQRPVARMVPDVDRSRRGPVVVLVDTSGSMHGEPELAAKAAVLAVLRVALRERRPCHVVTFSSGNDLMEHDLTDLGANLGRLLEFLGGSFRGGTDPAPALRAAVAKIRQKEMRQADILMVTDGVFSVADDWLHKLAGWKQELGFRIHTLLVGDFAHAGSDHFSDRTWRCDPSGAPLPAELAAALTEDVGDAA